MPKTRRNSPKRREAKRLQLIEDLNNVLSYPCILETDIKKLAEALVFLLEEK
jgi:hypothetical protein